MKLFNVLAVFLTLFYVFGFFLIAYNYAFYPSYLSYKVDCNIENINDNGEYIQAGSFQAVNSTYQEIILYSEDKAILKHEYIHYIEYLSGRLGDCSMPFRIYENELEAYIGMYLPDKIYQFIYGNFE